MAADPIAFAENLSVATAGTKAEEVNTRVVTSQGYNLVGRVQGGIIPDGATLSGYVLYAQD